MAHTNYVFLIGAPKAGTTSLARAFVGHPEVAVARNKEPRFFTDFAARSWHGPGADLFTRTISRDWPCYDSQFDDAPWRLDASTDYLSCPVAPERLAAFAEKHPVQVVAVLRDPVARIISEFQHTLRDGLQSGALSASLMVETTRIAAGWQPLFHHIARSRYASAIRCYRALFGPRFHVIDFHDPGGVQALIGQISRIMDVTPPAQAPHCNRSFMPRSTLVNSVMRAHAIRRATQLILPSAVRGPLRQSLTHLNGTQYYATPEEVAQIRAALADDIDWCAHDPQIPTAHWTLALGKARDIPRPIAEPPRAFHNVQP